MANCRKCKHFDAVKDYCKIIDHEFKNEFAIVCSSCEHYEPLEQHWIDNADSYICPKCGTEVDSPAKYDGCKCPVCGFQDEKDKVKSNKWIPCDVEQPQEDGEYLVTVWMGGYKFRLISTYSVRRGRWSTTMYTVIAWQPLPDAYKGE